MGIDQFGAHSGPMGQDRNQHAPPNTGSVIGNHERRPRPGRCEKIARHHTIADHCWDTQDKSMELI
jgi:hypothetical protein